MDIKLVMYLKVQYIVFSCNPQTLLQYSNVVDKRMVELILDGVF